jgi:hypothetical protein
MNDGTRSLKLTLPTGVALALTRLAKRSGSTQEEVLSSMITAADDKIIAGLAVDSPEWDRYMDYQKLRFS